MITNDKKERSKNRIYWYGCNLKKKIVRKTNKKSCICKKLLDKTKNKQKNKQNQDKKYSKKAVTLGK